MPIHAHSAGPRAYFSRAQRSLLGADPADTLFASLPSPSAGAAGTHFVLLFHNRRPAPSRRFAHDDKGVFNDEEWHGSLRLSGSGGHHPGSCSDEDCWCLLPPSRLGGSAAAVRSGTVPPNKSSAVHRHAVMNDFVRAHHAAVSRLLCATSRADATCCTRCSSRMPSSFRLFSRC